MKTLNYARGDATAPEQRDPLSEGVVIAHICNNKGAWGAGFVMAISKRWPQPEAEYRKMRKRPLGLNAYVFCETKGGRDIIVANMIAQDGFPTAERRVAVDYNALDQCLESLFDLCRRTNLEVAMPRIGCGIGGGDWKTVEALILKHIGETVTTVYDFA